MSYDRLTSALRAAHEQLCSAQTDVDWDDHRRALGDALTTVERLGIWYDSASWSTYRTPTVPDPEQPAAVEQHRGDLIVETSSIGIALVAIERARQVRDEGWSSGHDDEHVAGELARAAVAYGITAVWQQFAVWPPVAGEPAEEIEWPWLDHWYKPGPTAEQTLVKAGALIAAEIDRLRRSQPNEART